MYQNRAERFKTTITYNNSCTLHMHKHVEIFYVIDGALEITIAGEKRVLEKGMVSIAFPNTAHSTYTPSYSKAVMIIFEVDEVPDFCHEFATKMPVSSFVTSSANLEHLFYNIQECIEKNKDIRIIKGYLYICLAELFDMLELQHNSYTGQDITHRIINYINEHFTENITLTTLANELGYSKCHLSHLFNIKFGCSFSSFLNNLRAEYAMGLIVHSELSMTEICFLSGFQSVRTFYRSFESLYGKPPNKWRC